MSNIRMSFYDENENYLKVQNTDLNEICISINENSLGDVDAAQIFISTDTAIKFCKELRKEISKSKGISKSKDLIDLKNESDNGKYKI